MNQLNTTEAQTILIFKTNIRTIEDKTKIGLILNHHSQVHRWAVDLDDWEKVLKVETKEIIPIENIQNLIQGMGYACSELNH